MPPPQMTPFGLTIAALAAMTFSSKVIYAKMAYPHGVDATNLLAWRFLWALPFFLAIAIWHQRKQALPGPDRLRIAMLAAIGYYLPTWLDFQGLETTSVAIERSIVHTYPCWVLLLGWLLQGKKPAAREWYCMAMAYVGLLLVIDTQAAEPQYSLKGLIYIGCAALCWAVFLVIGGDMVRRIGGIRFMAEASCFSGLYMVTHAMLRDGPAGFVQPPAVIGWAAAIGLLGTVIPALLTGKAFDLVGPRGVALTGLLGPIGAVLLAILFLHEYPSAWQILGMLVSVTAIAILGFKNAKSDTATQATSPPAPQSASGCTSPSKS